ncbi:MAG: class I SAM-dependent methyltransferase [Myxococcales bacterium]|nr:MAG: class I SAM-dependent methyltransferase [Myxococcales bacterium]
MSWKSSSTKKNRSTADEQPALGRLASVRHDREPFRELSRRLIAGTLARYLPEDGPVIEIGMGDGQLRARLPDSVLPRVIHSEPDASVSRAYRRQHPQTRVIQAPAEALPFAASSSAAVLGLCVLDVVPDGAAVARELARVLRPGGRVIHWLDMSTVLGSVVESLWSVDLVPFPNCFTDPSAQEWPEDLWLMPRRQLALVVSSLGASNHPAAHPLGEYLELFAAPPRTPGAPTRELIQLQESPRFRAVLRDAFRAAFELAAPSVRRELEGWGGRPVSTAQHFQDLLRGWFSEQSGFRVELAAVERAWETTPLQAPELAYRSCLIGEQRHLSQVPRARLCPDAACDSAKETLLELGVFSFVATRIAD